MKTALDWLIEQMPYEFRANHTQELFRQAKEMEKEQIIKAVDDNNSYCSSGSVYYDQTYNLWKIEN